MIPSYSNLKNHLDLLKKYLTKMSVPEKLNLPRGALQQSSLKQSNPRIFLELLHCVICDYSGSFHKWVVEEGGSLEFNYDKKFIEILLSLARRKLGMEVGITVDQFLAPNKFLLQKIEFVGNFSKIVYEWDLNKKKSSVKESIPVKKQSEDEEDDDFENPRSINVRPTKQSIIREESNKVGKQRLNRVFKDYEQAQDKVKPIHKNHKNQKANVFPKTFKESESEEEDENQFRQTHKALKKAVQPPIPVSPASADPVTRQQFNEMLEMLSTVNNTVTNIVDKFNNFQGNVIGWINNINAKIGIMEENIKMIKNNL